MSTLASRKTAQAAFRGTYALRKNEKDPVIDSVHTLMDERGGGTLKSLAERANVSPNTIYNWIDGDTRCPQHAKIAGVIKALGYEFQIVPSRGRLNGHTIKALAPRIIREKL